MFVFSSLLLVPNSDLYSCSWCVFFRAVLSLQNQDWQSSIQY
jgi:hypothetical protein